MCVCVCIRALEQQAMRQYVLSLFGLPRSETLKEVMRCAAWTPHARCHTAGNLYVTENYMAFSSLQEGHCTLLIPLAEVQTSLYLKIWTNITFFLHFWRRFKNLDPHCGIYIMYLHGNVIIVKVLTSLDLVWKECLVFTRPLIDSSSEDVFGLCFISFYITALLNSWFGLARSC